MSRPFYIYVAWDLNDVVIYVGQTLNVKRRVSEQYWRDTAARVEIVGQADSRPEALEIERQTIRALAPVYNIQHNTDRLWTRHSYVPPRASRRRQAKAVAS